MPIFDSKIVDFATFKYSVSLNIINNCPSSLLRESITPHVYY